MPCPPAGDSVCFSEAGVSFSSLLRQPKVDSEGLDGGFMLQQDGNTIAYRVNPLAFVAPERLLTQQYQGLAADRAGQHLEQVRCDHDC